MKRRLQVLARIERAAARRLQQEAIAPCDRRRDGFALGHIPRRRGLLPKCGQLPPPNALARLEEACRRRQLAEVPHCPKQAFGPALRVSSSVRKRTGGRDAQGSGHCTISSKERAGCAPFVPVLRCERAKGSASPPNCLIGTVRIAEPWVRIGAAQPTPIRRLFACRSHFCPTRASVSGRAAPCVSYSKATRWAARIAALPEVAPSVGACTCRG